MKIRYFSYLLLSLIAIVACTNDAYESGDTSLSYIRAEMVDMRVQNELVKSITTDNDEALSFKEGLRVSDEMARPDTTYRMLLYYNKVGNDPIKVVSNKSCRVFKPIFTDKTMGYPTDPLTLTSMWMSANGKYINFSLGIKAGKVGDETAGQSIGLVCKKSEFMDNGAMHYHFLLFHGQNKVPQYYTVPLYFSLSTDDMTSGDNVDITVNTYNGEVTHSFIVK